MTRKSNQSIANSTGERWRRDGSSEGKLLWAQRLAAVQREDLGMSKRTERLLLEEQEDGVQKLDVFCKVVQLANQCQHRARGSGADRRPT